MYRLIVWFIIVIYLSLNAIGCFDTGYKYPVGKDSTVVVGDGRFQIGPYDQMYGLDDGADKEDNTIIYSDTLYYYDNGEDKLYVAGRDFDTEQFLYVVVDYKKNTYEKYKSEETGKMSQEDWNIFQSDKMKKLSYKD